MPKFSQHYSSHHFYVPPAILSGLIHFAEQHQLAYQHWFSRFNLDISQIRNLQCFVTFQQLCQVIKSAIEETSITSLGLHIGRSDGLISMGILGFAMQACKTVAEAMQIGLHYHRISGSVLDLNFHEYDDYCELEISPKIPDPILFEFFCDEVLSSILSCYIAMVGDQDDLLSIEINYKPKHFQEYNSIFNCPIHFNSNRNVMRFDRKFLNKTLKSYSPANYATAIQICEQTLQQITQINQASYAEILKQLIEQNLPERFDMKQAAQHLKISERHLRRQLLEDGLSFQQIRQDILQCKAKEMLLKNHTISEISQQLGFSELREFRRAFKRWTGAAPSIYKHNLQVSHSV